MMFYNSGTNAPTLKIKINTPDLEFADDFNSD